MNAHSNSFADRRTFLKMTGAVTGTITLIPFTANATPQSVQDEINAIIQGKTMVEDGRVILTLPEIAENGGTVPLTIHINTPMSAESHVKVLHIFADGNPQPDVASYFLGPANGKAEISFRLRLSKTQKVVAVAELNTGEILVGRQQVKVTLGGCGG